jgi:predicted metal-dependent HD superfamily phosphohydrolase
MFRPDFLLSLSSLTPDIDAGNALWMDIAARYSEPHRYYHTLAHLDALIRELSGIQSAVNDWELLVFAIAFHDVIYDTQRQDNEQASADYAGSKLSGLLAPERLQRCKAHILATRTHEPGADPDRAFFTDADLAILGAGPAAYQEYSVQIRKEYASYTDAVYWPGRIKVLKHFLSMPVIFRTPVFYDRYEAQARKNLEAEIRSLSIK